MRRWHTDAGQRIAARRHSRPAVPQAAAKCATRFPAITLPRIEQAFGGWPQATRAHFAHGGRFAQVDGAKQGGRSTRQLLNE